MSNINRRQFIERAVAGTVVMAGTVRGQSENNTGKRKIKIGLIGCGGYGMANIRNTFKAGGVQVVALCDIDSRHLEDSTDKVEKMQNSRPKMFKHYQKLLDAPGLEAVIIATPPQWHALMFIDALNKDLNVYCEKPLAYDVREGRAMVEAAKRRGRIVQIGFQRRQSPAIGQARDYIRQGNIGQVVQAEANIHYTAGLRDTTVQDPPATLDWDLWCGPAPKLPYCPQIGHHAWRLEKEYGHGHLVDWGIHLVDATRWILGETMPRSVQAAGGIYYFKNKITTPDILSVHFDFETCPVIWRHRIWGAQEYDPEVSNGIFFYGEKGTVFVSDQKWVVVPKGKDTERKVHSASGDMGAAHMNEFLEAVRTRKQPSCSTEDAYYSTATVKLAMIACDVGAKILWDKRSEHIIDNPIADKLLKREYRAPWKHPSNG